MSNATNVHTLWNTSIQDEADTSNVTFTTNGDMVTISFNRAYSDTCEVRTVTRAAARNTWRGLLADGFERA